MTALVSFERVFEILDLTPLISEPAASESLPDGPVSVEFAGVSFGCPSADKVSLASLEEVAQLDARCGEGALQEVSFRAEPYRLSGGERQRPTRSWCSRPGASSSEARTPSCSPGRAATRSCTTPSSTSRRPARPSSRCDRPREDQPVAPRTRRAAHLRQHHEEIEVARGGGIPALLRTEENHSPGPPGRDEQANRFVEKVG